jgi:hypothetical protein
MAKGLLRYTTQPNSDTQPSCKNYWNTIPFSPRRKAATFPLISLLDLPYAVCCNDISPSARRVRFAAVTYPFYFADGRLFSHATEAKGDRIAARSSFSSTRSTGSLISTCAQFSAFGVLITAGCQIRTAITRPRATVREKASIGSGQQPAEAAA